MVKLIFDKMLQHYHFHQIKNLDFYKFLSIILTYNKYLREYKFIILINPSFEHVADRLAF